MKTEKTISNTPQLNQNITKLSLCKSYQIISKKATSHVQTHAYIYSSTYFVNPSRALRFIRRPRLCTEHASHSLGGKNRFNIHIWSGRLKMDEKRVCGWVCDGAWMGGGVVTRRPRRPALPCLDPRPPAVSSWRALPGPAPQQEPVNKHSHHMRQSRSNLYQSN